MAFSTPSHSRFPAKVTFKKNSKSYSRTYSCKVTVKNPGIRMAETPSVVVGEKVSATTKIWPRTGVMSYKSSDETIATVDAAGEITGVKAGKATITATMVCGVKTFSRETEVTVKASAIELSAVAQTASNAFTATFTADASKTITKDDIKVVAADGSVELAVKSVEYATDGLTAKVTVFGNFTNAAVYKVTCKDQVVEFTAKVGAVARIAINTASAEQNVETSIDFTLFDAEGIDVTPSVALDTTCYVSVSGNYSAANIDRASKATITMNVVGDKAEVTITYNNNNIGAQDITATQTITCVDAKATQGTKLFASPSDSVYINSIDCAKFYLGLSDSSVTVTESGSKTVYFCAKDSKGDVISYDSYEVESSNDDVASASSSADGKFATITVIGNTIGSATLNVKATKNGKDTYYTIPVAVVKDAELASMRVSVTKPTMSDVNDPDYSGAIIAELFDKDGNRIDGDVSCSLVETTASTPIVVTSLGYNRWNGVAGSYTAANADARSYTIKVTAADKKTGKTIERNVAVSVKALTADKNWSGLKLTYQIELDRNTVDESPLDRNDDSVTARLYATYNGLFAGYVRAGDDGSVKIADGTVTAVDQPTKVMVAAKFGTKIYKDNLCGTPSSSYADVTSSGAITFNAVAVTSGGSVKWTPEGSDSLASTGVYTIEYRIYSPKGTHTDTNGKYTPRTQTFTVKNSVTVPTVTVTSRTVDALSDAGIIEYLKTNVDMNNNTSVHESIVSLAKDKDGNAASITTNNRKTVKYAIVNDKFVYSDGEVTWSFYVPINATFMTE